MIAFGPVPSRRLGQSLGINNIPPKHCSYSCVYCQVGRTDHLEIQPRPFYSVDDIVRAVEKKITAVYQQNKKIDFLTFVPDGEPTLDIRLGEEIEKLRQFGFPIAIICNSSLLDQPSARQSLIKADWVSLKVDSVIEEKWRKINRPHRKLNLDNILKSMLAFSLEFPGELVTETMLVARINDDLNSIHQLASFLGNLKPFKVYLSVPARPPAETWVDIPSFETLNQAFQIIAEQIPAVEILYEEESVSFQSTGNLADDILGITAVHPMQQEALKQMIANAQLNWEVVENLINENLLRCVEYRGIRYYLNAKIFRTG